MIRFIGLIAMLSTTPALAQVERPCEGSRAAIAMCTSERAQAEMEAAYKAKMDSLPMDKQLALKFQQDLWKPGALSDCLHYAQEETQEAENLSQLVVHECMTERSRKRKAELEQP